MGNHQIIVSEALSQAQTWATFIREGERVLQEPVLFRGLRKFS